MTGMAKPVCAVVGVGPGNGAAMARAMSKAGYKVALMSRSGEVSDALATELGGAWAARCDVTDPASIDRAFGVVERELGPVDVMLYNAGSGSFANVEETSAEDLTAAWRINCLGLFTCTQRILPHMKKRGGAIIVTGATASLRGGAGTAAFAQAKAAQRSLAQSMARHLGPQGIHVALVIVDGVIDMPRTRQWLKDKPDEFFLDPAAIAQTVVHLVSQPRSAWTFELDLRPHVEKW